MYPSSGVKWNTNKKSTCSLTFPQPPRHRTWSLQPRSVTPPCSWTPTSPLQCTRRAGNAARPLGLPRPFTLARPPPQSTFHFSAAVHSAQTLRTRVPQQPAWVKIPALYYHWALSHRVISPGSLSSYVKRGTNHAHLRGCSEHQRRQHKSAGTVLGTPSTQQVLKSAGQYDCRQLQHHTHLPKTALQLKSPGNCVWTKSSLPHY